MGGVLLNGAAGKRTTPRTPASARAVFSATPVVSLVQPVTQAKFSVTGKVVGVLAVAGDEIWRYDNFP